MATQEIYQSLSGSEIHAVFGNVKFADIQMLKYAASRQKAPVFTMGSADLRAVARGHRSINGALVFSYLSSTTLVEKMAEGGYKVFLSNDELANYDESYQKNGLNKNNPADKLRIQALRAGGTIANTGIVSENGLQDITAGNFDPFAVGESLNNFSNYGRTTKAFLADQLPPFDITLIGIPETAGASLSGNGEAYRPRSMIFRGVEFVSESSGTSIEDLVIEKQMSFIARSLHDWHAVDFR